MKVLLVVDVQRDFCPGGALAVSEGDEVVPVINRLMRDGGYDLIIASQDWHPANHGSFAANHPGRQVFEQADLDGLPQVLWPKHCVQHTPGADFHSELDTSRFSAVVRKGEDPTVDSYSAFSDNGKRKVTELGALLDEAAKIAGVLPAEVEIDVVGLALDYCVRATATDAARRGHRVSIFLDATRPVDARPQSVASVIRELSAESIAVAESRERLSEHTRESRREPNIAVERGVSP